MNVEQIAVPRLLMRGVALTIVPIANTSEVER